MKWWKYTRDGELKWDTGGQASRSRNTNQQNENEKCDLHNKYQRHLLLVIKNIQFTNPRCDEMTTDDDADGGDDDLSP